ncbi:hypothetical protein P167DRAFT_366845 [Morchella conica CCBAS932]|uniref:Transmembrane protein n=1 Tax=Morchella conica CCBAS932 TaxID=1392247 RepID=A0A3N4KFB8_9PEZI|nr:hypothetical protein P167DRAFT_366845 [Morchella conica CCBAS932]
MHKQEKGQSSSSKLRVLPRRGTERSRIRTPFTSALTITPRTSLPHLPPLSPVFPELEPKSKPQLKSDACHLHECKADGTARKKVEADSLNIALLVLIAVCAVLLQLFLWFCIGVHWVWCRAWEVPEGMRWVRKRVVGWVRWWESDEGREASLFFVFFCIFLILLYSLYALFTR